MVGRMRMMSQCTSTQLGFGLGVALSLSMLTAAALADNTHQFFPNKKQNQKHKHYY